MAVEKNGPRNGLCEPSRRDVPAMCEVFKHGQIYHHQMFPRIFCKPDNEAKIAGYVQSFLKPRNPFRTRHRFARAWFGDDILEGYVLFQLHKTSDVFFGNDRWFAHIEDIAIGVKFRQKGTASKLMKSLTDDVENLGGGIISGQVWRGNEASERLFEKSDFERAAKQFYRVI